MFGLETLSTTAQAAALVGIVLAESIALYVGYGGLVRLLAPSFLRAVGGE